MEDQLPNFLDYTLYDKSLWKLPAKPALLINTINQYSYCVAQKDQKFREALQASDVLLPDGMAVVLAAKLLTGKKLKKIAGYNLHFFMLWDLNNKSGSCFYLGSSKKTLKRIKRRVNKYFPNVRVETFSPPYKSEFTVEDNETMINAVNQFKPDVLFLGMTAPKQEKWAHEHRDRLDVKMICTIGAVFDFFSGTIKRPGKTWVSLGLEWFIRLVKEPKRLWRRYLYYGPIFIWLMIKEKVKLMAAGAEEKGEIKLNPEQPAETVQETARESDFIMRKAG